MSDSLNHLFKRFIQKADSFRNEARYVKELQGVQEFNEEEINEIINISNYNIYICFTLL